MRSNLEMSLVMRCYLTPILLVLSLSSYEQLSIYFYFYCFMKLLIHLSYSTRFLNTYMYSDYKWFSTSLIFIIIKCPPILLPFSYLYNNIQKRINPMPRSYSYFQANVLSPCPQKNNLRYVVDSHATVPYSDWTVAGIIFSTSPNIANQPATLFKIYTYAIQRGFQVFQVQANITINGNESKIQINFVPVQENDRLPNFQGDQIEMQLRTITSIINNEFHGQAYQQQTRDIYSLIEKIGWPSEQVFLKRDVSTIGYTACKRGGICMTYKVLGGIALIAAVYFAFKGKNKGDSK